MKRKIFLYLFAACILITFALFCNGKRFNEFPSHIHAWAQSDHYAIALGFVDNGCNLWKPQTLLINKQFGGMAPQKDNTVTAMDFPLHNYIVALLMNLFNTDSPWIFRLYTLLFSFLGLFYLYKIALTIGNSPPRAFLLIAIIASSPLFIYYQIGFLPSITSLTESILGVYFFLSYLKKRKMKFFFLFCLFFLLASLSRTTFILFYLSALGALILEYLQDSVFSRSPLAERKERHIFCFFNKNDLIQISFVMLTFLVFAAYYFYNMYLRKQDGSLFLNYLLPADSLVNYFGILLHAAKKHLFHYFSISFYLLFFYACIRAICCKKQKHLLMLGFKYMLGLSFLACIAFSIAMTQQFIDHDYYFLDTFFLPILLLFFSLVANIQPFKFEKKTLSRNFIYAALILSAFANGYFMNERRNTSRYSFEWDLCIEEYTDADKLLKKKQCTYGCPYFMRKSCFPKHSALTL